MKPLAQKIAARYLRAEVQPVEPERFVSEMREELISLLKKYKEEKSLLHQYGRYENLYVGFSAPMQILVNAEEVHNAEPLMAALQREVWSRGWQVVSSNIFKYERNRYTPHEGSKVSLEAMPIEGVGVDTPEVLYHITDKKRVPEILSSGLRPHKARAWLPDRVYLFKDVNGVEAGLHLNWMRHTNMSGSKVETLTETMDVAVLEIDPSKTTGLKLHDDPEWSGTAVYTASPIPGSAISVSQRHFRD